MLSFKVLRGVCLVGALVVGTGCVSNEAGQSKMSPAEAAIASLSYDQKAERFLDLIHANKLATPAYMQVQQMFEELYMASKAPDSKRAVLERYETRANTVLDKYIGWNALKPQVIQLYKNAFTEDELTQLIVFYDSPVGQKMIKQLPMLNMKIMQLIQSKQPAVEPELRDLVQQMAGELGLSPKTATKKK